MPEFYGVAVLMAIVAMLFVALPLMASWSRDTGNRSQVNIVVFREQLAALEQARQAGDYSEPEYQRLKTELERHLLDDTGDNQQGPLDPGSAGTRNRLLMALLVPLIAFFLYSGLGALADWNISQTLDELQQAEDDTARQLLLEELAGQLSERITEVDNADYYMLLARTQQQLNNYPAAVDAYRQLSLLFDADPMILGQYAQALYLASGRQMTAEVKQLVERVLALNPHQPTVLGMLGIDSFERGDYAAAANYWQQLLPSLAADSANAQMISQGIAQARELAGEPAVVASEPVASGGGAGLRVAVSLSADLQPDPDASVFVFARAVSGPPMPLAVARLKVADLPTEVMLDDSMAMTPALKLSGFEEVQVVARISSRGIANRGSGDLEGEFGPVTRSEKLQQINVLIDRVLP